MATTVRVEDRVAAAFRQLAGEEGRAMGKVIEDAVARYQKEKFWEGVHADVSRLRSDPVVWNAYRDEMAVFEGGSMDGLEGRLLSWPVAARSL